MVSVTEPGAVAVRVKDASSNFWITGAPNDVVGPGRSRFCTRCDF